MNDNQRIHTKHNIVLRSLFTLIVLLPLLLSASFAYQAGNIFELTAGTNKSAASSSNLHITQGKHPADTKALVPNSPDVLTAAISLLTIYLITVPISFILAPYLQMLKDRLLAPIKFTSTYVNNYLSLKRQLI
ncbi:hypothetical protein [Paenibacillus sp. L3-i20]|uniref:hypothetical protein n=1 Tax=Paenibacillus sp. L3-i20 TaxID=2905833 RepID=UPI001EDEB570|nr:hypothetical protein [Paenibacillus sp. L3-i20]